MSRVATLFTDRGQQVDRPFAKRRFGDVDASGAILVLAMPDLLPGVFVDNSVDHQSLMRLEHLRSSWQYLDRGGKRSPPSPDQLHLPYVETVVSVPACALAQLGVGPLVFVMSLLVSIVATGTVTQSSLQRIYHRLPRSHASRAIVSGRVLLPPPVWWNSALRDLCRDAGKTVS